MELQYFSSIKFMTSPVEAYTVYEDLMQGLLLLSRASVFADGFNIWSVAFVTIWMFPYQSLWQISQADRPMMMTIPLRMPHAPLTYSLRCLLEKNLSETLNVSKLLERQKVSFRYVRGRGGEFQSCFHSMKHMGNRNSLRSHNNSRLEDCWVLL